MQAICPIVKPGSVQLSLSREQFITVKRELNAGEYRLMISGQYKESGGEGKLVVDLDRLGLTRILAYGLGWSFVDFDGTTPLEFSESTIRCIDMAWFQEILNAVDAHHASVEKAVEERKNWTAGTLISEAISASAA